MRVLARFCFVSALWLATLSFVYAQDSALGQNLDDIFGAEVSALDTSPGFWSKLRVSGYLKNETAYRIREPRSITKLRNIFSLNTQYPISNSLSFNATGWAYYDHAYDLFNYETIVARLERDEREPLAFIQSLPQERDSPVAELREFYLDVAANDWDLRLGKQFIIWGVMEGVRVVDEMNPIDFRELILLDLLDYRIPLWSAKFDYYSNWGDFQLVWIPELEFHRPAPPGSEWEQLQRVPGTVEPESGEFENWEVGLRWENIIANTELSLSYFYTWDDFPVIFRTVEIGGEDPVFFPTYTRITMYGGTAVRQVGSYILKGELAYVTDKFFGRRNTADDDGDGVVDTNGVAQKDHIRWGLGVDFVLQSWDVALGATQWIILDYEDNLIQQEFDTSYSLFMRREFPQYSMTAQLLWLYFFTLGEHYIKPKVTFQVTNEFQFSVGLDLFDGEASDFGSSPTSVVGGFDSTVQRAQFVGNFSDNDRVFFEFKYSF